MEDKKVLGHSIDRPGGHAEFWAKQEEMFYRSRRTPTKADVDYIWSELKQIEHLLAIAENDPERRGKSAKRQASSRRWRLALHLDAFFPVPLPDGRIVTCGPVQEGKNKGNWGFIFGHSRDSK
jgi:hypothetical protein